MIMYEFLKVRVRGRYLLSNKTIKLISSTNVTVIKQLKNIVLNTIQILFNYFYVLLRYIY